MERKKREHRLLLECYLVVFRLNACSSSNTAVGDIWKLKIFLAILCVCFSNLIKYRRVCCYYHSRFVLNCKHEVYLARNEQIFGKSSEYDWYRETSSVAARLGEERGIVSWSAPVVGQREGVQWWGVGEAKNNF